MINWIKNKLSPSTTSAELSSSEVISTESSIQSEPEMLSTSSMQQSSQPTMAVAEASSTQTTSYLNLKKPGPNDYYNIDDQNTNSDIIDSEVKKHEERISAIESNLDVDNGLRSHDVATSSHLTSLPNNTKTGGNVQIKSLKGLSLVQITNGGNGENGLNDFLGVNGTLTMEGNTFVLTSGAKQYTAIRDVDDVPVKAGQEYFAYAEAMVTSEDCEKINLFVGGTDLVKTVNNPVQNKWYKIYGRKIATVDKPYTLHVEQGYADEIIANGKVIKVKNIKVFLLNSHLSKLTDEQLAYMASTSEYWKGIKSVQNPKIVSRGKNKFDGQLEEGYWSTSTGEPLSGGNCRSVNPTLLGAGDYRISNLPVTNHDKWAIKYDLDMNFIGNQYLANGAGSNANITMQQDGYLHFYMVGITSADAMIQIESGLETSSYTPYIEDEHLVYGEFHSLPNSVTDNLENVNTGSLILSNSNVDTIGVNWANVDYTSVSKTELNDFNFTNNDTTNFLNDLGFVQQAYDTTTSVEWAFMQSSTGLYITLPKGITLEKAQNRLVGGKIIYQLAEPIKREIPVNITSFESGDIIMTSDSGLIPEITFNTPANQGAMLKDVATIAKENNDLLQGLRSVQSAPINLSQNEPVKSVTLKGQANPKVVISGKRVTNVLHGDIIVGGLIWSTGVYSAALTDRTVTEEYIPVKPNTTYTPNRDIHGYCEYDSSKTYISEFAENKPITTSSTTAYVKMVVSSDTPEANVTLYEGDWTWERIPTYIKGTQETQDILIERRGENLNSEPLELGYYSQGNKVTNTTVKRSPVSYPVVEGKHYEVYKDDGSRFTTGAVAYTVYNQFGEYMLYSATDGVQIPTNGARLTFHSGDDYFMNDNDIMLIEGNIPPTKYIPPELDQVFLDEYLGDTDKVTIEGSVATVRREWSKPKKMFGVSENNFVLSANGVGYKVFRAVVPGGVLNECILTRFDGKNLELVPYGTPVTTGEQVVFTGVSANNYLYITVSNEVSGMSDSYTNPTTDEINACLNGWVMASEIGGNLYTTGNKVWAKRYQGIGTPQTLTYGAVIEAGTDITVCPKEKAYGDITETYTLRYKLATPETYTINLDGVLGFKVGVNHLSIRTGVRREKVCPKLSRDNLVKVNYIGSDESAWNFLDKKPRNIVDWETTVDGVTYKKKFLKSTGATSSYGGKVHAYIAEADITQDEIDRSYIIYETLSAENNIGIFTAKTTYTDSTIGAVESLLNIVDNQADRLAQTETTLSNLESSEVFKPTLLNGWKNTSINKDMVTHVRIKAKSIEVFVLASVGTAVSGSVAFKLPVTLPATYVFSGVGQVNETTHNSVNFYVGSNGEVKPRFGGAVTYVSGCFEIPLLNVPSI